MRINILCTALVDVTMEIQLPLALPICCRNLMQNLDEVDVKARIRMEMIAERMKMECRGKIWKEMISRLGAEEKKWKERTEDGMQR